MPKEPTEQTILLNGKQWVASEPLKYQLQPNAPSAVMAGQAGHADAQGVQEYPVDLGGPMGCYEQRLGDDRPGYWSMQGGMMINDGELSLGPNPATTTPDDFSTATDAGCCFCLSDIDGVHKLYLFWGDRLYKATGTTFAEVAQITGAKARALIETQISTTRALMLACGPGADIHVSYDGANVSAPWTGEKADLVFNHSRVAAGYERLAGVAERNYAIRVWKGSLYALSQGPPAVTTWAAFAAMQSAEGWNGLRYFGHLLKMDPFDPETRPRIPRPWTTVSVIGGRGLFGLSFYRNPLSVWGATTPFPEADHLGDITSGCNVMDRIALSNGKSPIYLWQPGEPPVPIGPFGSDGVPDDWTGHAIHELFADGQWLLAVVQKGSNVYLWRYDTVTGIWDVPMAALAGSDVGGSNSAIVFRSALAGGKAAGGEIEMLPDGIGTYDQWAAATSEGTATGDKWEVLTEEEPDGDETYYHASQANHKQTFTLSDVAIPSGHSIIGVRVVAQVRRASTLGGQAVMLTLRSDTTDDNSLEVIASGAVERVHGGIYDGTRLATGLYSYAPIAHTWYTDPATGVAWTQAGVNALEAGLKMPGAVGNVRCTWLRVYCIYAGTPSTATLTSRLWYGAGGASPKLQYVDLPATGWNLRGSGITCSSGSSGRVLATKRLTFNRPERQKIIYGLRFHGYFSSGHCVMPVKVSLDGVAFTTLGTVVSDGDFLRLPPPHSTSDGTGSLCRTLQVSLALYLIPVHASPILAPKGMVVLYNEVEDGRLLIGLTLDLERTAAARSTRLKEYDLVAELLALVSQGTLFSFKWADAPEKKVAISPMTQAQLLEELRRVRSGKITLWLHEPVPSL